MPKIKDPRFKDALGLAEGMEKGPDYEKNVREGLSELRDVLTGKSKQDRNSFNDPMGSEQNRIRKDNLQPYETIPGDSNQDRAAAYAALQALQRRRAAEQAYRESEMAKQPKPQSWGSDQELQDAIQQFQQTRKMLGR